MIGYYVHHHGTGHLRRAAAILTALSRRSAAVERTVFSSLARPDWFSADLAHWVLLPRDDEPGLDAPAATVGGAWHWAPQDSPGHRSRLATIVAWIAAQPGAVLVSDVSVEVAVVGRLVGARVVVVAQPGERGDETHQQAYRAADAILAPWPGALYRPEWLDPHADRVHYTGGISALPARPRTPPRPRSLARPRGDQPAAVWMPGSEDGWSDADFAAARAATPGWRWTVARDLAGPDLADRLHQSALVVGAAGLGTVADVAAANRPAVLRWCRRPFAEQAHTAHVLSRHGLATVLPDPPTDWKSCLEQALAGPTRWALWGTAGAAEAGADVLAGLAGLAGGPTVDDGGAS